MELLLLALYVGFALGISFLCSTLEAALLSVRIAGLVEQSRAGSRGAGRLLALKKGRIDDAISAILILNTISNTLGATMAGAQAVRTFGNRYAGWFAGFMTLAILVLSEIVPKTLGTVYASQLAPAVGHFLHVLTIAMKPLLLLSRKLTGLLTRAPRQRFSRGELAAVIETATAEGAISDEESTLFGNLLRLRDVRIEDVMTPRTVMVTLPADASVRKLLEHPAAEGFSRIPLHEGSTDEIVGYVMVRDVLRSVTGGGSRDRALSTFAREISFVPEIVTVDVGLRKILAGREPIAMVTDERGGVAGLVTLEDLTETILGTEIVDEFDHVVDLRQAAASLRDRRLERLLRERLPASASDPTPHAGEDR